MTVATLYCNNQSTILSLWKAILKETQKSNKMSLSYSVALDDRCYPDMRLREYVILNWGLSVYAFMRAFYESLHLIFYSIPLPEVTITRSPCLP